MRDLIAAAPPVTITGMSLLGFPITDWAALVSILWVLVLFYLKMRDRYKRKKNCMCNT